MRELELRIPQEMKDELDSVVKQFHLENITKELEYKVKAAIRHLILTWYSKGQLDPLTNLDGLRDMRNFEVVVAALPNSGYINIHFFEKTDEE